MKNFSFSKKNTLRFTTKQNDKKRKNKIFFISLVSFIVLFGGLSILVLLIKYDFNVDAIIGKPEESTSINTAPEEVEAPLPTVSGKDNFLVAGFDDDFKSIRFAAVVNADKGNVTFNVYPLNPDSAATVGNKSDTLVNHYAYGGLGQLKQAAEKVSGVAVDRYVVFTDSSMKDFIKALGEGLVVDVPSAVEYRGGDLSLTLQAGKQSIAGDTVMEYMLYLKNQGNLTAQADIICRMIDQYMVYKNIIQGESLFVSLINCVNSNITIADFNSYSDFLNVLARSTERKPASAVSTVAGFNEE